MHILTQLIRWLLARITGYTPMTDAIHEGILAAIEEDAQILDRASW